jgi:hypothetical protein
MEASALDIDSHIDFRNAAQRRRLAPGPANQVLATFENGASISDVPCGGSIELAIEATNAQGELAEWLQDDWWSIILERWWDRSVTVRVAPTVSALLHPIVLHHCEMVRRVTVGWRLIGHAYNDDILTDNDITTLADSPYHEVRFIDQQRPGANRAERSESPAPLPVLFSRIRASQARRKITTPILVRLPSPMRASDSAPKTSATSESA